VHIDMNHFVPIFTAFIAAFICIAAARKRRKDI